MIDFDKFYDDNFERYFKYAVSIVKQSDVAKDITQDSMIKLNESILDINPDKYHNWLTRVIKNKCIDHFRRNNKFSSIDGSMKKELRREVLLSGCYNDILDRFEAIDEENKIQKEYEYIMRKVDKLSPMYKLVFIMYEVENMSHAFISRELGISTGTSKSNLHKAKKNIRKMIGKDV